MKVAEMVARHATDERRPSVAVVVRPSAEALAPALTGGPVVHSWDERSAEEPGARTLVEIIASGQEDEQVAELTDVLGDLDVAILLFRPPPEMLPVGVVTDALSRHRLTVLDAGGTIHRLGRTMLAVSRDPERRQRAYLSGIRVPDSEAARLRQGNEWAIEGLQLRASIQVLEHRLEGQEAELLQAREEHRVLEQELTDSRGLSARLSVMDRELTAARDALAAGERSLAAAERPCRIRKAVRVLVEDPREGFRRTTRAIARRWRR
jgi:hypothetical protein